MRIVLLLALTIFAELVAAGPCAYRCYAGACVGFPFGYPGTRACKASLSGGRDNDQMDCDWGACTTDADCKNMWRQVISQYGDDIVDCAGNPTGWNGAPCVCSNTDADLRARPRKPVGWTAAQAVPAVPAQIPTSGVLSSCFWNAHATELRAAGHAVLLFADLMGPALHYEDPINGDEDGRFKFYQSDRDLGGDGANRIFSWSWGKVLENVLLRHQQLVRRCCVDYVGCREPQGECVHLCNSDSWQEQCDRWTVDARRKTTSMWANPFEPRTRMHMRRFNAFQRLRGEDHEVRQVMIDDNTFTWSSEGLQAKFNRAYTKLSSERLLGLTTVSSGETDLQFGPLPTAPTQTYTRSVVCGAADDYTGSPPYHDFNLLYTQWPYCKTALLHNAPYLSYTEAGTSIHGVPGGGATGNGIELPIADGLAGYRDANRGMKMNKHAVGARANGHTTIQWTRQTTGESGTSPFFVRRAPPSTRDFSVTGADYPGYLHRDPFLKPLCNLPSCAFTDTHLEPMPYFYYWSRASAQTSEEAGDATKLFYYLPWQPSDFTDSESNRRPLSVPVGSMPTGAQWRRPRWKTSINTQCMTESATVECGPTCTRMRPNSQNTGLSGFCGRQSGLLHSNQCGYDEFEGPAYRDPWPANMNISVNPIAGPYDALCPSELTTGTRDGGWGMYCGGQQQCYRGSRRLMPRPGGVRRTLSADYGDMEEPYLDFFPQIDSFLRGDDTNTGDQTWNPGLPGLPYTLFTPSTGQMRSGLHRVDSTLAVGFNSYDINAYSMHTTSAGYFGEPHSVRAWCGADITDWAGASTYYPPVPCTSGNTEVSLATARPQIGQCLCLQTPSIMWGHTRCNQSITPSSPYWDPFAVSTVGSCNTLQYDPCSGRGVCSIVNQQITCRCRPGWFGNASFLNVYVSQLWWNLKVGLSSQSTTWTEIPASAGRTRGTYATYAQLHQCIFWDGVGTNLDNHHRGCIAGQTDCRFAIPKFDATVYPVNGLPAHYSENYHCKDERAMITNGRMFGGESCLPCPVDSENRTCSIAGTAACVDAVGGGTRCQCRSNYISLSSALCAELRAPVGVAGLPCSGRGTVVPTGGTAGETTGYPTYSPDLPTNPPILCVTEQGFGSICSIYGTSRRAAIDLPGVAVGDQPHAICLCNEGYGGPLGDCAVDWTATKCPRVASMGNKICGRGKCTSKTWTTKTTLAGEVFSWFYATTDVECVCEAGYTRDRTGACTWRTCPLAPGTTMECNNLTQKDAAFPNRADSLNDNVCNRDTGLCECWRAIASRGFGPRDYAGDTYSFTGSACSIPYRQVCGTQNGICHGNGLSNSLGATSEPGCGFDCTGSSLMSNKTALFLTCGDLTRTPACLCKEPWTGTKCDVPPCPLALNQRMCNSTRPSPADRDIQDNSWCDTTRTPAVCVCDTSAGLTFAGPSCSTPLTGCAPRNNNGALCNGHGTCDLVNDICVCDHGYSAESGCYDRALCSGDCVHGVCLVNTQAVERCECDDGYGGVLCDFDYCSETGGTRVNGTCVCPEGSLYYPQASGWDTRLSLWGSQASPAFVEGCRKLCPFSTLADGMEAVECGVLGRYALGGGVIVPVHMCGSLIPANATETPTCDCNLDAANPLLPGSPVGSSRLVASANNTCQPTCLHCDEVGSTGACVLDDCPNQLTCFTSSPSSCYCQMGGANCETPRCVHTHEWNGTACVCKQPWLFDAACVESVVCGPDPVLTRVPSDPRTRPRTQMCECLVPYALDINTGRCVVSCGPGAVLTLPHLNISFCDCPVPFYGERCEYNDCPVHAPLRDGVCDCGAYPHLTGPYCNISACVGGDQRQGLTNPCFCFPLWSGPRCDTSLCVTGTGGMDELSTQCECPLGVTGVYCDQSQCGYALPPTITGPDTFTCNCTPAFEVVDGVCGGSLRCLYGAGHVVQRSGDGGSYLGCNCPLNFTGARCEITPCGDPTYHELNPDTGQCQCRPAFQNTGLGDVVLCGERFFCANFTRQTLPPGAYLDTPSGVFPSGSGEVNTTRTLTWLGTSMVREMGEFTQGYPIAGGIAACTCGDSDYTPRMWNATHVLGCTRTCAVAVYHNATGLWVLDPDECPCSGAEPAGMYTLYNGICILTPAPSWDVVEVRTTTTKKPSAVFIGVVVALATLIGSVAIGVLAYFYAPWEQWCSRSGPSYTRLSH
jgi:hypothetical protein